MAARISLVTYGRVDSVTSGPQFETYNLAQRLHDVDRLANLVCMDRDPAHLPVPPELVHPGRIPERLLYALRRSLHVIDRMDRLTAKRRLFEQAFDFIVSHGDHLDGAEAVLFNRPGFPRTVARARRRGIPTIGLASIMHPRFNAEIVGREQRRLGLPRRSIYTDSTRVRNLCRFYDSLDHLVVQTPLASEVFARYGIPEERIVRLTGRYPINLERFRPADGSRRDGIFRVLHVSNMNLIKGIPYLLDAWEMAALENAELVLAGPIDADIADVLSRKNLPGIRLVGPVADPAGLYRDSDIFVSPSISDSFPYTILEAMASGLPVIASANCGLSSLLDHGSNGFIYDHDQAETLASHLVWSGENRGQLVAMGESAREKAAACRNADPAGSLLECIDALLG